MCSTVEDDDRDHRSPRMLRCEITDPFGQTHVCLMKNISRHGLGGSGLYGLEVGQRLTIHLPAAGAVAGTVRWASQEKFGIFLDEEIDPDVVRLVSPPRQVASQFHVLPQHRPTNEWKRPALRA